MSTGTLSLWEKFHRWFETSVLEFIFSRATVGPGYSNHPNSPKSSGFSIDSERWECLIEHSDTTRIPGQNSFKIRVIEGKILDQKQNFALEIQFENKNVNEKGLFCGQGSGEHRDSLPLGKASPVVWKISFWIHFLKGHGRAGILQPPKVAEIQWIFNRFGTAGVFDLAFRHYMDSWVEFA